MAQAQAKIFQRPALQLVIKTQVALPLAIRAAIRGIDVGTPKINCAGRQSGDTDVAEIVAVACQPGALSGPQELADLGVGDQVGGRAVTCVDEGKGTAAVDLLITQPEAVPGLTVGKERTGGTVVDAALIIEARRCITRTLPVIGANGVVCRSSAGRWPACLRQSEQCAEDPGNAADSSPAGVRGNRSGSGPE